MLLKARRHPFSHSHNPVDIPTRQPVCCPRCQSNVGPGVDNDLGA